MNVPLFLLILVIVSLLLKPAYAAPPKKATKPAGQKAPTAGGKSSPPSSQTPSNGPAATQNAPSPPPSPGGANGLPPPPFPGPLQEMGAAMNGQPFGMGIMPFGSFNGEQPNSFHVDGTNNIGFHSLLPMLMTTLKGEIKGLEDELNGLHGKDFSRNNFADYVVDMLTTDDSTNRTQSHEIFHNPEGLHPAERKFAHSIKNSIIDKLRIEFANLSQHNLDRATAFVLLAVALSIHSRNNKQYADRIDQIDKLNLRFGLYIDSLGITFAHHLPKSYHHHEFPMSGNPFMLGMVPQPGMAFPPLMGGSRQLGMLTGIPNGAMGPPPSAQPGNPAQASGPAPGTPAGAQGASQTNGSPGTPPPSGNAGKKTKPAGKGAKAKLVGGN